MRFFSTAVIANMSPVLTTDVAFLGHYAYALTVMAGKADACGKHAQATRMRTRAYYLRTLVR